VLTRSNHCGARYDNTQLCYNLSSLILDEAHMPPTLKERVEALERQMQELTSPPARKKDWRKTFGMSANDPVFDEMIELGRKYREAERARAKRSDRGGT